MKITTYNSLSSLSGALRAYAYAVAKKLKQIKRIKIKIMNIY